MRRLRDLQASGGTPWMMDLVKTLHIALFSFMSFYHQIFSYKVFNETMVNTSICLISCFPQLGFFLEMNQGIGYSLILAGSW
jgi:hypothetical protein